MFLVNYSKIGRRKTHNAPDQPARAAPGVTENTAAALGLHRVVMRGFGNGDMMRFKRKVVKSEFCQPLRARVGHGSYWLTLECGHNDVRKASQKIPEFVYCSDCETRSNGNRAVYGNKLETWDEEKQMSIRTAYENFEAACAAMEASA